MSKKPNKNRSNETPQANPEAAKPQDLQAKLAEDLKSAKTQYQAVTDKLVEVAQAGETLNKQKIALEALISYIQQTTQNNASTDSA